MKKTYIKEIIEKFNTANIRYVLIGRQAVVLYGFPVTSFDYDFWVHPEDRKKIFDALLNENFDSSSGINEKKPLVFFTKDIYKIDIFFAKSFGKISFEGCFNNAQIFRERNFYIRVASVEYLIELKKFRPTLSAKNSEDIKFLKSL